VQVVGVRKSVLGEEHPNTLTSMAGLAFTYCNRGRWDQAVELQVQVAGTRERILGKEYPYTLTSMINLAVTYWN